MGKFLTTNKEISAIAQKEFGGANYLVVLKRNKFLNSLVNFLADDLLYIFDSTRNFILYFDKQGIHEKELSFSDHAKSVLMTWREIENFAIKEKRKKKFIEFKFRGKLRFYTVEFNGKIFQGNDARFENLKNHNFFK